MKLCDCGCGQHVSIAKANCRRRGHIKGQPVRFVQGHTKRWIREILPERTCKYCQCVFVPKFQCKRGKNDYCSRLCQRKSTATHGGRGLPEYNVWRSMRKRCLKPNTRHYALYGGRGIQVCERWSDFGVFLSDMGRRPSPQHSIDRKDNDGHYEPANCRWATAKEQANNRRRPVKKIEFNGESLSIPEWAERTGIKLQTLKKRLGLFGMSPDVALTRRVRGAAADLRKVS